MGNAKICFSVMFISLGLIAGILFGTFVVAKDHEFLVFLLFPGIAALISSVIGFAEVFSAQL